MKYDAIIIGAGMSGMAAGIRLAMYDKKVLIVEKHSIPGGLNSYYRRAKRDFDVGLHALTNIVPKGTKRKPLTKLLKQLRLAYDDLQIQPQNYSRVIFPEKELKFSNDFELLRNEVSDKFPGEIDGFNKLVSHIEKFEETRLDNEFILAKEVVRTFIKNQELVEMIFCPLLIYGSAWENDMDFSQFVIMFKSIYLEGFGRPVGGVRTVISLLTDKLKDLGCEIRYRSPVTKIITTNGKVTGVQIKDDQIIESNLVISSMGLPETYGVVSESTPEPKVGKLSFTESILCLSKKPKDFGIDDTIIFYNNRPNYLYRMPEGLIDNQSAVLCFSNNYGPEHADDFQEGLARVTMMANYDKWASLSKEKYKEEKSIVYETSKKLIEKFAFNSIGNVNYQDTFTPTTVTKYTSHFKGCVYGSTDKSRDGKTSIDGLVICGTDQGFLGVIGSMLSGISISNLYGLQGA